MEIAGDTPRPALSRVMACVAMSLAMAGSTTALAAAMLGQSEGATSSSEQAEMATEELHPTFKIQVQRNLVVIRAVVRDAKGRPVGNLGKPDFRVYDNGKLQNISQFAVETPLSRPAPDSDFEQPAVDTEALPETAVPASTPRRYVALYFDDIHANFDGLARTRDAAQRYLEAALQPRDRVAIFTASGRNALDFTDDRGALHQALFRLLPQPIISREQDSCPEISAYQAYLMVHERDPFALRVAEEEARECDPLDGTLIASMDPLRYLQQAEAAAVRTLNMADTEAAYVLRGLEGLVRRIAVMPGERNIIFISPGFMSETKRAQVMELVSRALRSNVIVNSIDSRGLYVPANISDVSTRRAYPSRRMDLAGRKRMIELNGESRATASLEMLAHDTGGQFFHNNNDFDLGFRKVGALPEIYYVLAFSPQNLKFDGKFHSLKVTLVPPRPGLTVQARHGYYAPQKPTDAAVRAKEEIEQAIFSQEELKELTVELHTQFFKFNDGEARLSILTHLDARLLPFRREADRNFNQLTVVTALFDRDGKYLSGKEKSITFRLRDSSLEKLLATGITTKTSFDVKPGTYLVRQVVREAEGGQLSGLNRTVEIPY